MNDSPYSRFAPSKLSLSDHLAIDRTVLANQRTLLAYVRTALALLVLGASLLEFYDQSPPLLVAGYLFIATGAVAALVGVVSYRRMKRRIVGVGNQS